MSWAWFLHFSLRVKICRYGKKYRKIERILKCHYRRIENGLIFGSGNSTAFDRNKYRQLANHSMVLGLNFWTFNEIDADLYSIEFSAAALKKDKEKIVERYLLYNKSLSLLPGPRGQKLLIQHASCLDHRFCDLVPEIKLFNNSYFYEDISFLFCRHVEDFKHHIDAVFLLRKLGVWPGNVVIGPVSIFKSIDILSIMGIKKIWLAGFDGGGKNFWENLDCVKEELRPLAERLNKGVEVHSTLKKNNLPASQVLDYLTDKLYQEVRCVCSTVDFSEK